MIVVQELFLILVINQKQPSRAISFFKDLQETSSKSLTSFFILIPVSFNEHDYEKNVLWNFWPIAPQVAKQVQKIFLLALYNLTKFDDVI